MSSERWTLNRRWAAACYHVGHVRAYEIENVPYLRTHHLQYDETEPFHAQMFRQRFIQVPFLITLYILVISATFLASTYSNWGWMFSHNDQMKIKVSIDIICRKLFLFRGFIWCMITKSGLLVSGAFRSIIIIIWFGLVSHTKSFRNVFFCFVFEFLYEWIYSPAETKICQHWSILSLSLSQMRRPKTFHWNAHKLSITFFPQNKIYYLSHVLQTLD